jgi:microcin C transport system permease protein
VIFFLTIFAEIIANDKPIFIRYYGGSYFPVFQEYPETTFGGLFETETYYKDEFIQQEISRNGFAIFPPIPFSYDTVDYNLQQPAPTPPSARHLLGTDDQGRDVLARIIYGFRISVLFGLSLLVLSSIIGIIAGAIQGYFGGLTDLLTQRFIEIWSSMPSLYLIIILTSVIMPNFWWLLLILLLFSWMGLVSVVRAESLKTRNMEYVKAAKVMGLGWAKILFRHVLPNSLVASITFMPFILSGSITTLTALDFLGLGLPPGSPSLGELLSQGKNNLQAVWLGLTGFFTIGFILTLLVFIGEAVRDSFNPHKN